MKKNSVVSKCNKYFTKVICIIALFMMLLTNVVQALQFAWPVPGANTISSPYGPRFHPIFKVYRMHDGIDIPAPQWTNIIASEDGTVTYAGYVKGYGNYVKIDHGNGFTTRYAHIVDGGIKVKTGQKVKKGDSIASVGSSGNSTGPHLHFEVRINEQTVNPVNYVSPNNSGTQTYNTPNNTGQGGIGGISEDIDIGTGLPSNGLNVETSNSFYYQGAPKGYYSARESLIDKIIKKFTELLNILAGLFISIIKLPLIGYAALCEVILTKTLDSITGQSNYLQQGSNVDLYVDPRRSVNIENIIFNRIELLNIDFFINPKLAIERMKGKTSTGQDIEKINRNADITGSTGRSTEFNEQNNTIEYEQGTVGLIRAYFASIYYIIFSLSILFMLIALLILAIQYTLVQSSTKKADIKIYLNQWLKTFVETFLSIAFVIFIIKLDVFIVKVVQETFANQTETFSLYEQIRTRAYDFRFTVGFPAAVMYIILVWYTVRFTIIYLKRVIIVMVYAIFGPIIGVYELIMLIIKNTPDKVKLQTKWYKEFMYLVLIQIVHVISYTIIISVVMDMAQNSLVGFILAIYLLKLLLKVSNYIRTIFDIKSEVLNDLLDNSKPQDYLKSLTEASLIYSLYKDKKFKSTFEEAKNIVVDKVKKTTTSVGGTTVRNAINLGLFVKDALPYSKVRKRQKEEQENRAKVYNVTLVENSDEINTRKQEKIDRIAKKGNLTKEEQEILLKLPEADLENIIPKEITEKEFKKLTGKIAQLKMLFEKARLKNALTQDEDGYFRVFPPVKQVNPITGKTEIISSSSRTYFKNLNSLLGIDVPKFKENMSQTILTLKDGLDLISMIMLSPIILTEGYSSYYGVTKLFNMNQKIDGQGSLGRITSILQQGYKKSRDIKLANYFEEHGEHKTTLKSYFRDKKIMKYNGMDPKSVEKILRNASRQIEEIEIDMNTQKMRELEIKRFVKHHETGRKKYTNKNKELKKLSNKKRRIKEQLRDLNDYADIVYLTELKNSKLENIKNYLELHDNNIDIIHAKEVFEAENKKGDYKNMKKYLTEEVLLENLKIKNADFLNKKLKIMNSPIPEVEKEKLIKKLEIENELNKINELSKNNISEEVMAEMLQLNNINIKNRLIKAQEKQEEEFNNLLREQVKGISLKQLKQTSAEEIIEKINNEFMNEEVYLIDKKNKSIFKTQKLEISEKVQNNAKQRVINNTEKAVNDIVNTELIKANGILDYQIAKEGNNKIENILEKEKDKIRYNVNNDSTLNDEEKKSKIQELINELKEKDINEIIDDKHMDESIKIAIKINKQKKELENILEEKNIDEIMQIWKNNVVEVLNDVNNDDSITKIINARMERRKAYERMYDKSEIAEYLNAAKNNNNKQVTFKLEKERTNDIFKNKIRTENGKYKDNRKLEKKEVEDFFKKFGKF